MKTVSKNLRIAFPELTVWERRCIAIKFYFHMLRCLWQWFWLERIEKKVMKLCSWSRPLEEMLSWRDDGSNFILCTGHFGNWEIANLIGNKIFEKYAVIVKEQKSWIGRYLTRKREKIGLKVWVVGKDERKMMKEAKDFSIATVIDHHVRDGIKVKFFSKGCFFPRGVVKFAKRFGHRILPVFVVCRRGRWLIDVIDKPVNLSDFSSEESLCQYLTDCLEKMIKKYPHQYLWTFKRWKHSWELKIAVLTDGRMGHRHQSMALVEGLKRQFPGKVLNVKVIDLSGIERNFVQRIIVSLCGLLPLEIGEFLIKNLFRKYEEAILKKYYDVILSTGSSLVGLNVFLKRYNYSKSVVIMDPGFLWRRKVDLIIAPSHDRLSGTNVVNILGAVAWFDEEKANHIAEVNGIPQVSCCVLVGGECKKGWDKTKLLQFLECLCDVGDSLAITTSPRTPKWFENELEKRSNKFKFCCLYKKGRCSGIVPGLLARSNKVICTPDSISMISEALASGRQVAVWISGIDIPNKHRMFLEDLSKSGKVKILSDLSSLIQFLSENVSSSFTINSEFLEVSRFL